MRLNLAELNGKPFTLWLTDAEDESAVLSGVDTMGRLKTISCAVCSPGTGSVSEIAMFRSIAGPLPPNSGQIAFHANVLPDGRGTTD